MEQIKVSFSWCQDIRPPRINRRSSISFASGANVRGAPSTSVTIRVTVSISCWHELPVDIFVLLITMLDIFFRKVASVCTGIYVDNQCDFYISVRINGTNYYNLWFLLILILIDKPPVSQWRNDTGLPWWGKTRMDFSVNTWWKLTISSTNIKQNFSD